MGISATLDSHMSGANGLKPHAGLTYTMNNWLRKMISPAANDAIPRQIFSQWCASRHSCGLLQEGWAAPPTTLLPSVAGNPPCDAKMEEI